MRLAALQKYLDGRSHGVQKQITCFVHMTYRQLARADLQNDDPRILPTYLLSAAYTELMRRGTHAQ